MASRLKVRHPADNRKNKGQYLGGQPKKESNMQFKSFLLQETLLESTNLFIDMDGVLVDWVGAASKLLGHPITGTVPDDEKRKLFAMQESLSFWENLPWTRDGKILWNYAKQFNPLILSAADDDLDEQSKAGKIDWCSRNLGITRERMLIVAESSEKKVLAKPGRVLIDDYSKNIQDWESRGGIGVHHTTAQDTIKQLSRIEHL